MARRSLTMGAIVASAALALVGCSSSDEEPAGSTTPSSSSDSEPTAGETTAAEDSGEASGDLVAWAEELCTGLSPIDDQFSEIDAFQPSGSDPAALVASLQDAFGQLGPAFDDARGAVENAGPPPVDDGQQIYDGMIALFEGAGDAFGQISDELAAIDPNDPEALAALEPSFSQLAPELETLSTDLDDAFNAPEMKAAFDEAASCADLNITN